MKAKFFVGLIVLVGMAFPAIAKSTIAQQGPSPEVEKRIQREVRHQLVMLPFLDVFDNLTYKVDGYDVTLGGQVTRPSLKSSAEAVDRSASAVANGRPPSHPAVPLDLRLRAAAALRVAGDQADPHHREKWTRHSGRSCGQRDGQEFGDFARQERSRNLFRDEQFSRGEVNSGIRGLRLTLLHEK